MYDKAAYVPCQISRPAKEALTWAGLIDWQTIKVQIVVQVGPTTAIEGASCQLIRPGRYWPAARLRSDARVDGPAVQSAMAAGPVADAPTETLRTGRLARERERARSTGNGLTYLARDSVIAAETRRVG